MCIHRRLVAAIMAAVCVVAAGCSGSSISRTTISSTSGPSTSTSTIAPNDPVKGTTFDACAAIADTDIGTWGVDPATRRDAHKTLRGQNVRGCVWSGKDWGVKVYAVDGDLSHWEQPDPKADRQERIQIGSRTGWLVHDKNQATCSVAIQSQQAIASVQVDVNDILTKQRYDQCPLAVQIMTQIEPKIP